MARTPARRPRGFRETQGRFVGATPFAGLFAAYGTRCAFTGEDLSAEAATDPRGYLLNLSDDPLTEAWAALVPACLDAVYAFEQRHLTLGPRYNFLVDLARISPEFLSRLNPSGRLRLPADPALHPPRAVLAPHLIAFASGEAREG